MSWKPRHNTGRMKIIIVGYPRTGKTRYSSRYKEVIHMDGFMEYDFREQLYKVLEYIEGRDSWVIEGMQGMRLFRKLLEIDKVLPDKVIYMDPQFPADENHKMNRKQLDKIWKDCEELNSDNVVEVIHEQPA